MSVTSGFFNAMLVDGRPDRTFDARDISNLFNGLILDGVFMSIGTQLRVTADSGNNVYVGAGKAWFNGTWTINDAPLQVYCEEAEVLQDRIDAIILEIGLGDDVRENTIKFIKGTPSSKPTKPVMTHDETLHQYALCYIYRSANSTVITQANIENMVGTSETPFVSGVLEGIDMDELLGQWRAQLDEFVTNESADLAAFMSVKEGEYNVWFDGMKDLMDEAVASQNEWTTAQQTTILEWFDSIRNQLSEDSAVNLQMQIDENEIKQILLNGFVDGTKNMLSDGTVIISEDAEGRTLTTTFTNNFLTITTVLNDSNGTEIGRLVTNISSDGAIITSEVTIA